MTVFLGRSCLLKGQGHLLKWSGQLKTCHFCSGCSTPRQRWPWRKPTNIARGWRTPPCSRSTPRSSSTSFRWRGLWSRMDEGTGGWEGATAGGRETGSGRNLFGLWATLSGGKLNPTGGWMRTVCTPPLVPIAGLGFWDIACDETYYPVCQRMRQLDKIEFFMDPVHITSDKTGLRFRWNTVFILLPGLETPPSCHGNWLSLGATHTKL